MEENEIGKVVVDTAVGIHREMGPGLLESVYEIILANELRSKGYEIKRQVAVPIEFKRIKFEEGFRADLIVNSKVIIELKCIERLSNAHKKQLLTYLRLTGLHLGFLLNFGEALMKNGIHRIVNKLPDK